MIVVNYGGGERGGGFDGNGGILNWYTYESKIPFYFFFIIMHYFPTLKKLRFQTNKYIENKYKQINKKSQHMGLMLPCVILIVVAV